MDKLNDPNCLKTNGAEKDSSGVSSPKLDSQRYQQHGRLAIFIESPGNSNYHSKSKKKETT